MKKSCYLTLAVLLLAAVSSNVHSQAADTLEEWMDFVAKFIPEEVQDDQTVRDMLGAVKPGRPFSEAFDPANAQKVFFDKVVPQQDCYFDTLPNGELPQEECSNTKGSPLGGDAASKMTYNLDDGSVQYMNRGRDPKATTEAKLTVEQAKEALLKMSLDLGIPREELGDLRIRELIVAGNASNGQKAAVVGVAPEFERRVGVFGLIPRCMPVAGQSLQRCIPVVDGGIRAALVDGGSREPPVVTAWYQARYNQFEILNDVKPLTPTQLVTNIAQKLSQEAILGSYEELQINLTYATNAELAGESGNNHCPPAEADEKDAEPTAGKTANAATAPPNLLTDRSYLPAVQVFALPQGWEESRTIDPDKITELSTGISVFSIALAQGSEGECPDNQSPD